MEGKEPSEIRRTSRLILVVSLALGLLFDVLIFDAIPGVGFPIFIALIVAGYFGIAFYQKRSVERDLWWLFPVLLFFAAMVAIRASLLLMAINILGCALLLLLVSEVSVRGSLRQFVAFDYLKLFIPPVQFVRPLIASCADALSIRQRGDNKNIARIVRGTVITVPILVLFALLFASADPVFSKYASRLLVFHLDETTLVRGILIFAVAISLIGAFAYSFGGKPFTWGWRGEGKRPLGTVEISILLGSVNVLFLSFIVIQLAYLFGGESNIAQQGMTYAEYARRGFFELIAVALVSYLVLFAAEKYVERDVEAHSAAFKLLSAALVLQVVVIMASAFLRLSLYEEAFGFTTLRLYSHAFIILLGAIFALLVYKIIVDHRDATFAFRSFLAVLVFAAGMNLFNPDAFIAEKNLDRYAETGKLDVIYLTDLSADATPVTISALDAPDENVRGAVGRLLLDGLNSTSTRKSWQSWNISRENERSLLEARRPQLEQYANFEIPTEARVQGDGL